jgi:Tol biopolymer transport system component
MRAILLRGCPVGLLALIIALCGVVPADAQYFGRNNPQFRTFDFQVLRTEHFDIYYYPEAEEGIRDAARMAERWYVRLSQILGHEFAERQPLILYGSHSDFQQTNILGSPVGEGTGGVTESLKQRVIMPLAHTYAATDHVLGHEIVHAFQYDMSGLGRSAGSIDAGARALAGAPLWFVEGMAEYLTLGPVDSHTAMWLRDAAVTGQLPTLRQLGTDPRIFPYRYGHAVWSYITGRYGDAVVGQILRTLAEGVTYQQAIQRVLSISVEDLSGEWQAAVRRTYLPLLADYVEAREVATPLVTRERRGGRINVGPAVSPDGRRVAFLSERGLMDIELWLADAETGEVVRRLVRGTAFDAHFGSLNFLASAGTFSPDGNQLAFAALRRGTDVLAIVDVGRARVTRQIQVPGVTELANPSWSPDGRTVVVAGTSGGLTNLYEIDLTSGESRQLTTGRNADLMPEYSPDGQRIAFVTDRGPGTDLATLRFGGYRIAVLDRATGAVEIVHGATGERNINPVWTPDGTGLYFISDRTGVANIFRLELATGTLSSVTRIFQGVSGFTELSPALAGARGTDRLVFSVFNRTGYDLFRLDDPVRLAGQPVEPVAEPGAPGQGGVAPPPAAAPSTAVLPPLPRSPEPAFNRVSGYLADALTGLPAPEVAAAWPVEPYRARIELDYIAPPQVGFSTGGAYGQGGLHGGIAAVFSDMLAWHMVYGIMQGQGELDQIGFALGYLYQRNRWDFGLAAQRLPRITAQAGRGRDEQGRVVDQLVRFRTFDWRLQGMAQLPLSRVQRLEFMAGGRRIARDIRIEEWTYDPGGIIYEPRTVDAPGFNFAEASAALVFDNAVFGFTSPIAGQRYRFEVSPTAGDLSFLTALADYRRYLWLQPLTLAGRGIHFGRYGVDEEDERLLGPIFLAQPQLLRGYDYNDLVNRCFGQFGADATVIPAPCTILNQVTGNRVAVANLELRFPLVQALVLGTGMGVPPIEGFLFYDAGLAWGGHRPLLDLGVAPGEPVPFAERVLSSAGIGGRINLFGFAILEVDFVRPLVGERGWFWQFALQPGF